MTHYRHLKEHVLDEATSKQLNHYALTPHDDIKSGEFFLHGRIYSLPYAPVPAQFKEHFFYLQQYALMDMDSTFYTKRKNYDSYLFLFTLSGKGLLTYNGSTYPLNAGDGFLIDCHEEHIYQANGTSWKHIVLHFNGHDSAFYYKMYFANKSPLVHFNNPAHCQRLLDNIIDSRCSIQDNREFYTSIHLQTLLVQLTEHQINSRPSNETTDNIRYLCKYIENHFSENLSLNDMASLCGFHPSYLCRAFKKETGYSPKEYLTLLRLEQAKELLSSTSIPVYKIGILIGIPDETNFTRLFKKYIHDTPGIYREKTQ